MFNIIEKDILLTLAYSVMEWAVSMRAQLAAAKYDLVANICHDSSGAQVCSGYRERSVLTHACIHTHTRTHTCSHTHTHVHAHPSSAQTLH